MLKHKLKSRSGASLLIALIFVLLSAMTGAVILVAASGSAGQIRSLTKNKQSYYAVISAARLLKEQIEGEKYSWYEVRTLDNDILKKGYYQTPEKGLKEFLIDAVDQVISSAETFCNKWNIETNEEQIEKVSAVFTMDTEYNITIVLSQKDISYQLYIPAVLSIHSDAILTDQGEAKRSITTLTWNGGEIERN